MQDRLRAIADEVLRVISNHKPDEVAMEGLGYNSHSLGLTAQVHGAVLYNFANNGARRPYFVAPATLKKFATGSGKGEKGLIQMSILDRWGEKLSDNNQADAYVVARIAGALHGGITTKLKYEIECLKVIRKSYGAAA
jgi:crossover junction endodeoxyribonuclease RuvC